MVNLLTEKTLLVPFDFSEPSAAAVDEAFGMADESTRFHVLHVLPPAHMISIEPAMVVDTASDNARIEGAIRAMKKRINDPTGSLEFAARIGDPGLEIVDYAKEISADFIFMPSHGRTGLQRLLLGSVAERVVRLAECPVLVLKQKPEG